MARNFKPVSIKVQIELKTQKELNLYNTFLSELAVIKKNPRATLKKWF